MAEINGETCSDIEIDKREYDGTDNESDDSEWGISSEEGSESDYRWDTDDKRKDRDGMGGGRSSRINYKAVNKALNAEWVN